MSYYYAKLAYGTPHLIELYIVKETERTLVSNLHKERQIMGWHSSGRRVHRKNDGHLFTSEREAVKYLLQKAIEYRDLQKKAYERAIDTAYELANYKVDEVLEVFDD